LQRLRAIALISICGFALPATGQAMQPEAGICDSLLGLLAFPPAPHVPPAGIDPIPEEPLLCPSPAFDDPVVSPVVEQPNDVQPASSDESVPQPEIATGAGDAPAAGAPQQEDNRYTLLPPKPAYANVWDHIRTGFKIPTINDPLVTKWENFYAARPDYWQRINERSRRYLYFITKEIERRGMPLEIALLPVIESAFNPEALSRARAVGIWQFVPATGKEYGLDQNWWQDNRRDVSVATIGALDYLDKLYAMFGDWQHALAAYNWGEGAVQRAIAKNRARGKPTDWASLKIPNETRNYLPKLQAVKNIVLAPERFALGLPEIPDAPYFVTVTTPRQIDVALAAKLADMPLEDFKVLNPAHNRPVIAGHADLRINLPHDKAEQFVFNLDAYQKPLVSWRPYRIKQGEKLDHIAPQFGIELDELKRVNGLTGRRRVITGYTLLVPAKAGMAVDPIPTAAFKEAPPDGPGWHRVRRGESLSRIADRYGVTIAELKKLNGLAGDAAPAGRKLRLHDGVALGVSKSKVKGVKKKSLVLRSR
jgi:membrane-bound lytic murein transglycosylase D